MSLQDNLNSVLADEPVTIPVKAKTKPRKGKSKVISKPEVIAELFAQALIRNKMNASAAYREMRPEATEKTAGVEGHKLLKNPRVIDILTPMLEGLFIDAGIETEYVFRRWLEIASGSAMDYYKIVDGEPVLDMSSMTPAQYGNLKSISITQTQHGTNYKIETYDAQKALETIGKHLGLLVEKLAEEDISRIGDIIEMGVKRIKATKDLDGWKSVVLDVEAIEVK